MLPNLNPRQMEKMMSRLGIKQIEIPAKEVIIKGEERDIVIIRPQVSKINLMGQETFQIRGEVHEQKKTTLTTEPDVSDEDIRTVIEQTGVKEEIARRELKKHKGDLAETILALKKEE